MSFFAISFCPFVVILFLGSVLRISERQFVGFGSRDPDIVMYIANRPRLDDYSCLKTLQAMEPGEIAYIVQHTSNHWRKVFNVLAKFLAELRHDELGVTWQGYRDNSLLQQHSNEAILFSPPNQECKDSREYKDGQENSDVRPREKVHIILGKTHASALDLPFSFRWIDPYFAVNQEQRFIIAPYPDYRQLSNVRITQLVSLVRQLA
ncbi:MAG: hypothetical protein ACI9Y1_001597 [Lentisphaeria bacterium]